MGPADPNRFVMVGRISGLYGVKGWVKVFSHTEPRENILTYSPWYLRGGEGWAPHTPAEGRRQGKGIVVRLEGIDDREQARGLIGAEVAVAREQLPEPAEGEYYWADLVGLEVTTTDGVVLGRVAQMMETGANDVLVVAGERERLIPFLPGRVVTEVDLSGGRLVVDWDPEF